MCVFSFSCVLCFYCLPYYCLQLRRHVHAPNKTIGPRQGAQEEVFAPSGDAPKGNRKLARWARENVHRSYYDLPLINFPCFVPAHHTQRCVPCLKEHHDRLIIIFHYLHQPCHCFAGASLCSLVDLLLRLLPMLRSQWCKN